jgi:transcription termination factor Rho
MPKTAEKTVTTTQTAPNPAPAAPRAQTPVQEPATPVPQSRPLQARTPVQAPQQRMVRRVDSRTPLRQPRAFDAQAMESRPLESRQYGDSRQRQNTFDGNVDGRTIPDAGVPVEVMEGLLDLRPDGSGILRKEYKGSDQDSYISSSQVRRFGLRPGDLVAGPARKPKENERFWGLLRVDTVNGKPVAETAKRPDFMRLTPVYPDSRLNLETSREPLSTRIIDLVSPIGKGQRSMVVSPPKAGKTTILKDIATGIAANYPEVHLMAVLIGERPEEVTDIERHLQAVTKGKGEVASSNFDEPPPEQTRISELALERARRLVEMGHDVVILMDSITRLARAYNLAMPTSGRTLSGGFDPAALYPPKRFFGAARNFENGTSLTIIGTALVDTGSRMDDLIYEEFKGTGNQELHLSRKLANRRIYPAIDVQASGTRRDDLLYDSNTYQAIVLMHRMFDMLNDDERTDVLIDRLRKTKSNKEFLATLKDG